MTASRPETVCFLIPYFYFCVALVLHLLGYATPVSVLHLCYTSTASVPAVHVPVLLL